MSVAPYCPQSAQRSCLICLRERHQCPRLGWYYFLNQWLSVDPAAYVSCLSRWIATLLCLYTDALLVWLPCGGNNNTVFGVAMIKCGGSLFYVIQSIGDCICAVTLSVRKFRAFHVQSTHWTLWPMSRVDPNVLTSQRQSITQATWLTLASLLATSRHIRREHSTLTILFTLAELVRLCSCYPEHWWPWLGVP